MFYKYNKNSLLFESCNKSLLLFVTGVTVISFLVGFSIPPHDNFYQLESAIHVFENENEEFSKDALVDMIKELGIKYPHIVLAQSILETGHWTSLVYKENNNLFGMKLANRRIRTAKGIQLNHAYYHSWQESVYDYAFYQCRYLSRINSEDEYFAALDATYAEAGGKYSSRLKQIIQNENLKSVFE